MEPYILGVDGGNTKTDYFLFTREGEFIDHLRDSTCSQEAVGFDGAQAILGARIGQLLSRNGISLSQIAAAAFGLAGIDTAAHQQEFTRMIHDLGIHHFAVDNDSFLGIIAGTTKGHGICSINGTGTVAGGIDPQGNRLQVGGIGPIVGDMGGGGFIAGLGVRKVYESYFRCGIPTVMSEALFRFLGISGKESLHQAINDNESLLATTEMTRIVFTAAGLYDEAAMNIMEEVGLELAKTAAGCARNLAFDREIEIVLAGSVWVKAESPLLREVFQREMAVFLPDKQLVYTVLEVPPATGAVLWAMSLTGVNGHEAELKKRVVLAVEKEFGL